jgi:hypothetical protein
MTSEELAPEPFPGDDCIVARHLRDGTPRHLSVEFASSGADFLASLRVLKNKSSVDKGLFGFVW